MVWVLDLGFCGLYFGEMYIGGYTLENGGLSDGILAWDSD
jgi:hypothetical protein